MYPLPNRIIHWLTLILGIAAFASIELRELFERGTENRDLFKFIHFQIGAFLFLLTLVRLINKKLNPSPAMVEMDKLKTLMANGVHLALIGCLIVMPILGVSVLIAEAKDITILGIDLPHLMDKNKDTAHFLEDIHETLGNVFMFIIFAHAAAAIWHHHFLKDDTLTKMLKGK
jgi:cytochrome b561